MVLSDFLSRQKHDDSNPHEFIPISFNMQSILQSKYYNIGKGKVGKYLVQTRLQAKSSGISLPKVHDAGKGSDPNILPGKQVIKPIIASQVKGISQIKSRLGQGGAGLRWKVKTNALSNVKPIVKLTEKPIAQPRKN